MAASQQKTPDIDDIDAYLVEQAKPLQVKYAKVNEQYRALQAERRKVALAIERITGESPEDFVESVPSAPAKRNGRAPRRSMPASGGPMHVIPQAEREEAILSILSQEADGMNATDLSKAMGISAATMRKTLEAMIDAGKVNRTGQKRNTLYFAAPKS